MSEHYVARQEGGRVYYTRSGQGDESLLFIGGLGGRSLRNVTDSFEKHFTCYVLDMPGSDYSDIPRKWLADGTWTIEDYTDAVIEVMDAIGIGETFLIGDHTGAIVALNIASKFPGRVKKLVLDSLGYWDLRQGGIIWDKFYLAQHTDTTSYDVPVRPLIVPYQEMKATDPGLTSEQWQVMDELNRRDRRWLREHMYANSHFDVEAVGPKVKTPTLLIYGEREILRRGEQRALNDIKGSILKIIADSPKLGVPTSGSHGYQPEAFSRAALGFLLHGSVEGAESARK